MALSKTYEIYFDWASCPSDILFQIFSLLDIKSLLSCRSVNQDWQKVVDYYCEHFNLWANMVKHGLENEGVTFSEKSNLICRDQFLRAQQWLNVKNATVRFHHQYKFQYVRNICVYKDNLIVTTNLDVRYFNIESCELIKIIQTSCLRYEETSFIIAELSLPGPAVGNNVLTVTNKLNKESFDGNSKKKFILLDISLFKVHLKSCYVIDVKNVLWIYTASEDQWDSRVLAKYYGYKNCMNSIHIHMDNVYVLLSRGDVLLVDLECKKFKKVFQFEVPLYYLNTKLFMFHNYSALFTVQGDKNMKIYPHKENSIGVACPGLTCAMEHGYALILGYEDGKIEIFLTNKLLEECNIPEVRFYLQNHIDVTLKETKISGLDIGEDHEGNHLFVMTTTDIYELLICY